MELAIKCMSTDRFLGWVGSIVELAGFELVLDGLQPKSTPCDSSVSGSFINEIDNFITGGSFAAWWLIAVVSLAIATLFVMVIVGFAQGREIIFWPPKIGARPNGSSRDSGQDFGVLNLSQPNSKPQIRSKSSVISNEHPLKTENSKLKSLLTHIYHLHRNSYVLKHWKKTYIINSQGDLTTIEKMSIAPLEPGNKIYFWHVGLGVYHDTGTEVSVTKLKAVNSKDNHQLEIAELDRDRKKIEYAVILDPPATATNAMEIEIESFRPNIFKPLLSTLEDKGGFRVEASELTDVEVKFVAPKEIKLVSFSISPHVGNHSVCQEDGQSCIKWKAENLQQSLYTYVIRAERDSGRAS